MFGSCFRDLSRLEPEMLALRAWTDGEVGPVHAPVPQKFFNNNYLKIKNLLLERPFLRFQDYDFHFVFRKWEENISAFHAGTEGEDRSRRARISRNIISSEAGNLMRRSLPGDEISVGISAFRAHEGEKRRAKGLSPHYRFTPQSRRRPRG
uniref:Uncharacterized protein n=1 Tax=Candidatus Kentrum sp. SD TaxID=2126332 RepID=A0A450YQH0_9GAMM|nr:MAG: hypothetical protein BECKSD772F_GA0070984_101433 [Candidatus Kentron sp. SD]VFK43790.1 MAG: hypothetical protein BECKSD772E_GA0070983_102916 [Candidatus Kentron sp. SD]